MPRNQQNKIPWVVELRHGLIHEASNGFVIPLIARVIQGNGVRVGVEVTLKQGSTVIGHAYTDNTGEAALNHVVSLASQNTAIEIRAIVGTADNKLNVVIPEKKAVKSIDAERLNISNYVYDNSGLAYCDVHVIDKRGKGLGNYRVNAWYHSKNRKIKLDKEGHAVFRLPRCLDPGEKAEVIFTVDDVVQRNKAVFMRPNPALKSRSGLGAELARDIPLLISLPISLIAFPLFFISIYNGLFAKTMLERLESGSSGLGWIFIAILCFIFLFLFSLYLAFLFVKRKTKAIKQDILVHHYKHSTAKDSWLENATDWAKEWRDSKPRKVVVGSTPEASSVEGHGATPSLTRLVIADSIGEGISKLGTTGLASLFKWFKK